MKRKAKRVQEIVCTGSCTTKNLPLEPAAKSGIWQKNGLKVNTSPQLVRKKAVESVKEWSTSFNPLALWNSHYARELDDSGYIGPTL